MKGKILPHQKCEEGIKDKCRWEAMSWLGVLKSWPDIICEKCREHLNKKGWKL